MRSAAFALFLAACSTAPVGPQGATGPRGPQGLAGPRGPAGTPLGAGDLWVWRDAAGVQLGGAPTFVDDRGFQWALNQETGEPYAFEDDYSVGLEFESPDCTGTAYLSVMLPMRVFRVGGETQFRARPIDLASEIRTVGSYRVTVAGGCPPESGVRRLIPADATLPDPAIVAPSSWFSPPLRFEPL